MTVVLILDSFDLLIYCLLYGDSKITFMVGAWSYVICSAAVTSGFYALPFLIIYYCDLLIMLVAGPFSGIASRLPSDWYCLGSAFVELNYFLFCGLRFFNCINLISSCLRNVIPLSKSFNPRFYDC